MQNKQENIHAYLSTYHANYRLLGRTVPLSTFILYKELTQLRALLYCRTDMLLGSQEEVSSI